MNDGAYYELTEQEYKHFLAEMFIHLAPKDKLNVVIENDQRLEAAKMMFHQVATSNMNQQTKDGYYKVALEILSNYNEDIQLKNKQPIELESIK